MPPSQLPHNILFPTDFSKSSVAIVDHVVGLASAFKAKVWLLSVVPSLADFHGVSEHYYSGPFNEAALVRLEGDQKLVESDRLQRLERLQKQYFSPVESEICVKSAGVAESIVDYAGEIRANLIMMPTHGLGRMRRFLIGSVTAKVLHDASCPVWTSPHPRELDPFRPYRHIVLAIDQCGLPVELLIRASELAEFFHGQLSVLSALPPNGAFGDEAVHKRTREMARLLHDQIAARGIKASVHLMEGSPGDVVRQIAEEIEDADLIVTGRGHLEESMGHLRTHAYEIIRNAPCPVITW
ncbi:MAG: universal stress protein [Bryobacteraceae bacterium]|jgi:nucleotide-binding universal stress UspA family protein